MTTKKPKMTYKDTTCVMAGIRDAMRNDIEAHIDIIGIEAAAEKTGKSIQQLKNYLRQYSVVHYRFELILLGLLTGELTLDSPEVKKW